MSTTILQKVGKVLQDGMHNLQLLEDLDGMSIIPPYIDNHPQQVRAAGLIDCQQYVKFTQNERFIL